MLSAQSYFGDLEVRSGEGTFTVDVYAWKIVGGTRLTRILALEGRFIGGLQLGDDGLEDVLYRADLYSAGIEIMR